MAGSVVARDEDWTGRGLALDLGGEGGGGEGDLGGGGVSAFGRGFDLTLGSGEGVGEISIIGVSALGATGVTGEMGPGAVVEMILPVVLTVLVDSEVFERLEKADVSTRVGTVRIESTGLVGGGGGSGDSARAISAEIVVVGSVAGRGGWTGFVGGVQGITVELESELRAEASTEVDVLPSLDELQLKLAASDNGV